MGNLSKISMAAALGVGTFLLAGCGSSAGASNTLLGQVKSTHQLIIAESAFAPQDYQNPQTKQWTGYDVDILRGFAKSLGAKLKIDALPFSSSIQAVADKRADITIDIYKTANRAKVLSFSRPMLNYDDAIAVNSQSPGVTQDSVSALKGKTIAVVTGSAEVPEAQAVPGANVTQYGSVAESFLALSEGRVAADFQPDTDIAWAKRQNPSLHIKILGAVPASISPPIQSLRGYFGVPKGSYSQSFLNKLNAYLKTIAENGTEQKILDKYGMTSPVFLKGISSAPNS
ncbi:substrate-binding periplasmic protein [Sulfobacillus harzensis]|uniref:Amino acid ABC transporter substrate-binding protein n=1 Tax=Sulfobacillus harzensis TaxID=2729629 RepID=A0A7Y0L7Q9_9FIRM|nr:transporter substrate-binding domain-containing protein [Sulfobacillus harzensis]NMP24869.1 amino acid ABC transporter substrate-binding protein [Sulfobacillus harzensis]